MVPSGRLLSSSVKLTGSFTAGTWARLMALQMMSFIWLWRCCLGGLLRQDSPCSPRASTGFPHTQVCGSQALQPSRWATSTLMASSDNLSPTAVIGGAWSQSPEWGEVAARSLAVSTSLTALAKRSARWFAATGPSQAFCMCWTSAAGLAEFLDTLLLLLLESTNYSLFKRHSRLQNDLYCVEWDVKRHKALSFTIGCDCHFLIHSDSNGNNHQLNGPID